MDIDKLKRDLQGHFTDGLVTIIGSGLSAAEGIPGMIALRDHLLSEMPKRVDGTLLVQWQAIQDRLQSGEDIETALHEVPPSPELETVIVDLTAALTLEAELRVVNQVVSGTRVLRFTRLLRHMLKPNTGIPIITTNYDRLLEVGGECAGLGIDTLFVGHHVGILNEKESSLSFCRGYRKSRRREGVQLTYRARLLILKPHGSLDWFLQDGEPIRCPYPLNEPRLIITPGLNKYRTGYDRPFDAHRERANREIDKGARYLIIGYGFNDNHLETHLHSQLRSGKPSLVLARRLSPVGAELVSQCNSVTAITADSDVAKPGAWVVNNKGRSFLAGPNLWDVETFVEEVFRP
ncbi:MAG: SIR2 family protein [candidate division Zixibacteria bacterium]|nr:SIR2 family protein [candidate division Zixibacteria bacterium]